MTMTFREAIETADVIYVAVTLHISGYRTYLKIDKHEAIGLADADTLDGFKLDTQTNPTIKELWIGKLFDKI